MKEINCTRDSIIFKEGSSPVNGIYLVKRGEFEETKVVVERNKKLTGDMLKDKRWKDTYTKGTVTQKVLRIALRC